jgi:hypothetical protein
LPGRIDVTSADCTASDVLELTELGSRLVGELQGVLVAGETKVVIETGVVGLLAREWVATARVRSQVATEWKFAAAG